MGKGHARNEDIYLNKGGVNETSAADLRSALDVTIPAKADKVSTFGVHTLFLSHFDGVDESTAFVDEIGHTFTLVGTPNLDSADSFFGGSSLRLDNGTTLKVDDSPDWDFGTSDFTIETFAKFESHVGEYRVILARGVYYDQPSMHWGYQPTNNRVDFQINTSGGSHLYGFGFAPTDGVWYHMAIVRTAGTIKMYIDGISQTVVQQTGGEIGTYSVNNTNKPLEIGGVADFPAQNFVGWLDEFRISNNARYTANFTIPASPFTLECDVHIAAVDGDTGNLFDTEICHETLENTITDAHTQDTDQYVDFGGTNEVSAMEIKDAVTKAHTQNTDNILQSQSEDTNTVLLLHGNGDNLSTDFPDSSPENHSVSVVGDVHVDVTQSKFGGASINFDGSTGYLTIADNANWNMFDNISSGWTFDSWIKIVDTGDDEQYIVNHEEDANNRWLFEYVRSTNSLTFYYIKASVIQLTLTAVAFGDTNWHHVALVKDGTNVTIYLDGIELITGSTSTSADFAGALSFGNRGTTASQFFRGWMDEIRISTSARWTADFTPSNTEYDPILLVEDLIVDGIMQKDLNMNGYDLLNFSGLDNKVTKLPLDAQPFTHYKMNDNAANTIVTDAGAGLNNGVSTHNTSTLTTTGQINQALQFNGTSQYIDVASLIPDIISDTVGSFAFWYKRTDDGLRAIFTLSKNSSNSDIYFTLDVHQTYQMRLRVGNGAGAIYDVYVNVVPTSGTWYHIAVVQNGVQLKIYVDGVEQTLTVNTGTTPSAWLGFLTAPDQAFIAVVDDGTFGKSEYFEGSIDDFRYYSGVALSSFEVDEIYNSGTGTEFSLVCSERILVFDLNGDPEESGLCLHNIYDMQLDIDSKTSAYRDSFVNADLSSGILTVPHNLGEKYVSVQVYDNNDKLIIPDEVTLTNTTTLSIDLSSFGTLTGTWNLIVIG